MTDTDSIPLSATGVYWIINLINGKRYVGSASRSFADRFKDHLHRLRNGHHHSPHLQASWDKHGEASFDFVPIAMTHPCDAVAAEQHWMDELKPEYNVCRVAGSPRGYKHTEDARKRMGAAQRLSNLRPEVQAKRSASAVVTCARPETKAKMLAANREIWSREETRAKHSASLKAAFSRPDVKARLCAANKQSLSRPEVRAKLSVAATRATTAMWADPDARARQLAGLRAPDVVAHKSVVMKRVLRGVSQMTREIADEALRLRQSGLTQKEIGIRLTIGATTVQRILSGEHWIFEDNAL